MRNIQELRGELAGVFAGLKAGTIKPAEAAELNNSAGKIISSCKVELEYFALRKERPEIPFLDAPEAGR